MPLMKGTICDSCLWVERTKSDLSGRFGSHVGRCWFWWDYSVRRSQRTKIISELAFPYGNQESKDTVFSSVDYAKLNSAVANAFDIRTKERVLLLWYIKTELLRRNTILVLIKTVKFWVGRWPKALRPPFWNTWKTGKYDISKPAPIVEWQQDKRKILQQMICFTWILD
jgi:hypothetical protein